VGRGSGVQGRRLQLRDWPPVLRTPAMRLRATETTRASTRSQREGSRSQTT